MPETMLLSSPLPFLAHPSLFPAEKPYNVDNNIIIITINTCYYSSLCPAEKPNETDTRGDAEAT